MPLHREPLWFSSILLQGILFYRQESFLLRPFLYELSVLAEKLYFHVRIILKGFGKEMAVLVLYLEKVFVEGFPKLCSRLFC